MWYMHEGMGWWMVFGGAWMLLFWGGLIALILSVIFSPLLKGCDLADKYHAHILKVSS